MWTFLFLAMFQFVFVQMAFGAEEFFALIALKGFVLGVNSLVSRQMMFKLKK